MTKQTLTRLFRCGCLPLLSVMVGISLSITCVVFLVTSLIKVKERFVAPGVHELLLEKGDYVLWSYKTAWINSKLYENSEAPPKHAEIHITDLNTGFEIPWHRAGNSMKSNSDGEAYAFAEFEVPATGTIVVDISQIDNQSVFDISKSNLVEVVILGSLSGIFSVGGIVLGVGLFVWFFLRDRMHLPQKQ